MGTIKMAIIGAGQIARVTHIPNYQSMERVEVVGVCDTCIEAAEGLARQFGIPRFYNDHIQMLEELKPDAVTICVPNRFHCPITIDALKRGCHVLCEKPRQSAGKTRSRWKRQQKNKRNFCPMVFISGTVSMYGFKAEN